MNFNFPPLGFPMFRNNSFYKKPIDYSEKCSNNSYSSKEKKIILPNDENTRCK